METKTKRQEIESLISKAANSDRSEDALKWSQAACNAANALCALKTSEAE